MPLVTHNTHSKRTGNLMRAAGMRASWTKYFEDAVKADEKSDHDGHIGTGERFGFFPKGSWIEIRPENLAEGIWKASVLRPAGREGIATGTSEVLRTYRFQCDEDPREFLRDIVNHPEGLVIEPHGWAH
tara:strand:+ start:73 stop:459 length:387 start_codon:yes stop_codon:yes gene_type:complete